MLVKASLELPGFSTLDVMAGRIRREVNTAMFERIADRIGLPDRVGLESLLEVVGSSAKTPFNPAQAGGGEGVMVGVSRAGRASAVGRLSRRQRSVAGGHRGVEDRRLRW